jgi:hypothetical protein
MRLEFLREQFKENLTMRFTIRLWITLASILIVCLITVLSQEDNNINIQMYENYLVVIIKQDGLFLKDTYILTADENNISLYNKFDLLRVNNGFAKSNTCLIFYSTTEDDAKTPDICSKNETQKKRSDRFWYDPNEGYFAVKLFNKLPNDLPNGLVCSSTQCSINLVTMVPSLTPTYTETATPAITSTYTPTSTPTSTDMPTPTNTFLPSTTVAPSETPTPTFVPTNTPLPPPIKGPKAESSVTVIATDTAPVVESIPLKTDALINDLAWSPSFTYLAAALTNGDLCVWIRQPDGSFLQDAKKCSPVHGGQIITDLDWNSQGNKIASVGADKRLHISLVTADGLQEAQPPLYNLHSDETYNFMQYVDWGTDETTITTAGAGVVDVWDVTSGDNVYRTSSNTVIRVQGNIQADKVVTIGSDRGLRLIDTKRRSTQSLGTTTAVGIDTDWATNGLIASLDANGNLRVYQSIQQDDYVNIAYNLSGVTAARFSKTGRWIAVATSKGVHVYQASESYHLLTIFKSEQPLNHIAWSEDETQIAASDVQGQIHLWSLPIPAMRLVETNRFTARPAASITDFTWDREGKRVALIANDDTFSLWEVGEAAQLVLQQPDNFADPSSIDWSARHNLLAFGDCPPQVLLWDITDFTQPVSAKTIPNNSLRTCVSAVAFNASGTLIAIGDQELVRIWDWQKDVEVGIVRVNHPVNDIEWDANQRFVVVSEAGEISVYEWIDRSDQAERVFQRQPNGANGEPIQAVAWSPTSTSSYGKYATAGEDDRGDPVIAIWNTQIEEGYGFNGAYVLRGHLNTIISMSWNKSGQIASLGDDGEVIIWDEATGARLERIVVPNATHLRWSPINQELAISTSQGEMIFYQFSLD